MLITLLISKLIFLKTFINVHIAEEPLVFDRVWYYIFEFTPERDPICVNIVVRILSQIKHLTCIFEITLARSLIDVNIAKNVLRKKVLASDIFGYILETNSTNVNTVTNLLMKKML